MVAQKIFRTLVLNDDGNHNYPYLNKDGERWDDNWNWIDNDFNLNGRVAVSETGNR